GYNQVSPTANPLPNMKLLQGLYMATDVYGWTEFSIDPDTQKLTVTTYGIQPYSQAELEANPAAILGRVPQIVTQFEVTPELPPAAHLVGSTLVVNGSTGDDHIEVELKRKGNQIVVENREQSIGVFNQSAVNQIIVNGLAGNDRIRIDEQIKAPAILFGGSG